MLIYHNTPVTKKEFIRWGNYAGTHTPIEFGMYLKYRDQSRLELAGFTCLKFWKAINQ